MNLSWDYIVIGAGSAGSVIANRLSADISVSVLLVEAGPWDYLPYLHVPAGEEMAISSPRVTWTHNVEPDVSRNGRRENWPAGRVLGGSSSINGMVYARGSREDYDAWERAGNAGWSFDDVLPYFKRSESNSRGGSASRGNDGLLSVSDVRSPHGLAGVFLQATSELGIPRSDDLNGGSQIGADYLQATQKNGWRHSTSRAFLWPARRRRNLTIVTRALVHRVVIKDGVAVGIEYRIGGQLKQAGASREVIVSAGTLGSPKLLMLSGIGSAPDLSRHGIQVIRNRPGVGANLQEHPGMLISTEVNVRTYNMETSPWAVVKHGLNFLVRGRGPGTTPIGHAMAFHNSNREESRPDVQLVFTPIGYNPLGEESMLLSVPAVVIAINVCRPRARGTLALRSSNPEDLPVIRLEMLSEKVDIDALREGAKTARRLFATAAFRPFVRQELHPGSDVQTDAEWDVFLRASCMRFSHPAGTCKMGLDPMSVVGPDLRVHGIERLRVADASIMPTLVSANTNATAIMIGEKAADLIRAA